MENKQFVFLMYHIAADEFSVLSAFFNLEKRILASACPSFLFARLSARMSRARTGQIYVKYDIPVVRICQENPNVVKIIQIYRTLDMKAQVGFNVAGEIRKTQKSSVRMKSYQAVTTTEEV